MLTPSYSLTSTERVLPRLALDFTTASLDPRVTVSRALNTATRVNSAGYIETVNANLPRFDYSPTSVGLCNGLLIEEARANLCLYSNDFSVLNWSKNNVLVTAAAAVSPDGTTNAYKVECTGGGAFLLQSVTATSTSHTYTIYAKQGSAATEAHRFMVRNNTTGTNLVAIFISYATGAVTYTTGSTGATTTNAGNGWWRVTITVTSGVSIGDAIYVYGGFIATGIAGQFFYAYGAQMEAGAFATSYIPTTTTSLTRNADVVSMTGTNFSSWYNATEGAFVSVADTLSTTGHVISADNGASERIYQLATVGGSVSSNIVSGGVNTFTQSLGSVTSGTPFKTAIAYKANDANSAVNAVAGTTDTTVTIPTIVQLRIGTNVGGVYLNGHVASIRYFPQRLTNAELQAFTK